MISRFGIFFSIFVLSSCTSSDLIVPSNNTGSIVIFSPVVMTGTTITPGSGDIQPPLVENLTGSGDEYNPIFNGIEKKVIHIKHTSGKPTTIAFINSEAKSVEIAITFPSASGANLRWSQVVLPDGTMDGPFGQIIGYNLKQFGGYQFIFNENMMAGNRWSGEADITFTLRDTTYKTDVLILD
ncbi:hypothetical protein HOO68_02510 [Candidatus Gracilibacteria bacterium]|nr:hypothetical protein [Candidatus Gracilibacteria bacterium]